MEKKEDEKANKITFRSVPEFRGLFIDQCLAQATEHGFSGTSLKQTSWGNLCKFFSEKYDCTITQKKLRNHWDYLRTQYVTWSRLLARTGHGYNAETNTFDWSEEQWSELDKTIKNASQFKNKGLEDAEKLQNLFDGKFSTGVNRDTPGRMEPPCSAGTSTTNGSDSRISLGKEQNHEDDNF
ncbi:L10-interacting MYB domain-containing protein-like [Papaver somniferum]|uniref:L10-interacting MYB domain-containing protein-like n=1 Tax=Papaver somniferum TaxID=3469 RepID=UPI000E7030F2|nr:L10-interacting MYB domain-containing protein-like [Papaver somniferum]